MHSSADGSDTYNIMYEIATSNKSNLSFKIYKKYVFSGHYEGNLKVSLRN